MTEPVEQYRADSIMAMNAFNRIAGGLANPLSGLGTMRDRTTSSSIVRGRVLSQGEINTLYYGDAFIQKAIDLVVKEAYRSWVTFDFADNTKLKAGDFLQYMWRLKFGKGKLAAREAFLQASVLARKDGDAFILVGVVDDALLEEPVGDKIESIAWLRVMSKNELYPEPFWLKAQEEDFGDELPQDALQPDFYRVARSGQRVHHTRVLRFSGNKICDRSEIIGNSYFHHSVIQNMYKAYSRWEEGLGYGAAILGDIETYTLGIKGMGKLLQDDLNNKTTIGQEALLLRGQSISMGRSVVKTLLYDLEGEKPGNVARGYTGAEGIMDRLERAWAASSGTPRWKLFEESGSAGLASSVGSAQILRFMWADIASTWASENWKEPLDQLSFLVFKAKDSPTSGVVPDEWGEDSAKFPNTISLSRQEQMELEKLAAERAQILVQMGAIAPEEVRREYEGSSFSINIPLLPEVDKRMKEQLRTQPPPQPSPTQELPDTPVKTDEDELREDATWGVWVSTRTTPFVCEASSREEAISKLRKSSVVGHDANVVSARQLEGSSLRKARRGEWVRERANGESTPRLGGSRHVSAASPQEIEGVANPEGESTRGKSKVRPWLFDEDDTLAHFNAGLISRIDALEMLGYENAEELAGRFDQEFLEQTKSIEEVKADDIIFPSYENVSITVDDLNQLIQMRVDDEELLAEAIASVCGEQLAELLEMRHDVDDPQLWLEAIAQSYKNDTFQGFIDFTELQAREWGGAEVFLIQRANLPDLFAVGFKSEVEAEEMYLSIAPLDGYLGIEDLNISTLDADDIRLDRTYVRDARGRFAKVGSTGSKEHPEKKVEIPERITIRTNIAQLKAIADKHGIETPPKPHIRYSWRKAIQEHEEGKQYFEKKSRKSAKPEKDEFDKLLKDVRYSNHLQVSTVGAAFAKRFLKSTVPSAKENELFKKKIEIGEKLQKLTEKGDFSNLDLMDKLFDEFRSAESSHFEELNKRRERLLGEHEQLRKALIQHHGMSAEEARALVGETKYRIRKDAQAIREHHAELYQMSGGKGAQTLKNVVRTDARAHANRYTQELNVGKAATREDFAHEFGHHVEYSDDGLAIAASEWMKNRATTTVPQKLSKLTGVKEYKDEVAYPGDFISPYVGKYYSSGATEVISMGVERFVNPQAMQSFHEMDEGHYNFTLGVLLLKRRGS